MSQFSKYFFVSQDDNSKQRMKISLIRLNEFEYKINFNQDDVPYEYFTYKLDNTSFNKLKIEQGLMFLFDEFPTKFINLLNMVNDQSKSYLSLSKKNQSYIFAINEITSFRQICQLSLELMIPPISEIKLYYAEYIKNLQEEISCITQSKNIKENELSSKIELQKNLLHTKDKRISDLNEQIKNIQNEFTCKAKQEIDLLNQKMIEVQKNFDTSTQNQIDLAEKKFIKESENYKRKLENLVNDNKNLTNRLNQALLDKQNNTEQYKKQIDDLQQDNYECKMLLKQLQERYEAFKSEKESYVVKLGKKEEERQNLKESIKTLMEDLDKGHEIIRKLQTENRILVEKISTQNTIMLKQEETVESHRKLVMELDKRFQDSKHEFDKLNAMYQTTMSENVQLREQNANFQEKLALNETVINWLNKQIAEFKLGGNVSDNGKKQITHNNKKETKPKWKI